MKTTSNRLKGLVFINQTLSMGGAENFNLQLLSWFKENGYPVRAWVSLLPLKKALSKNGIKTKQIPIIVDVIGDIKGLVKGLVLMPFASIYYAAITYQNRNQGTILLTGYIEKILVTPWAKIFNVPVVWIEFGPLKPVFNKFFGLPKLLYRTVSGFPDYVIEPSKNTRKNNTNIVGYPVGKTFVIPCSIGPLPKVKAKIKKHTAYSVSRMEPGKGQDLLILAWPKVLKKYPDAKLYLVGEGDFRSSLEKSVRSLKISKSVIFLGWVKDLAKTVAPYSLGVFPTVWEPEGMSLVFMEAMSIGKPIVCFKWGSNLELVDSKSALMVEKGNVEKLSDAIIKMFSHPKLALKLGNNAKLRYERLFALEKTAPKYLKIFLDAQEERQRK